MNDYGILANIKFNKQSPKNYTKMGRNQYSIEKSFSSSKIIV